jgi:16S rRNA (guanine527-N7)-methyltransferase
LDDEEFFCKQILDSLAPLEQSKIFKQSITEKGCCVDVGFGGGFPLVPLARALPGISFLGIEKVRKKIDAVSLICDEFGIKNINFSHSNLSEVNFDKKCVITLKAVGTLENYLPLINATEEIDVFFYKGPNFKDLEGHFLQKTKKSWEIIEEKSLAVAGASDRLLIGLRNKDVLHGTLKSKSKLKDLTSLISN